MGYRCFYCGQRHATLEAGRQCAETDMLRLLKRETEPKPVVVDLDLYRRYRERLRDEARARQPVHEAGLERARAALRGARQS